MRLSLCCCLCFLNVMLYAQTPPPLKRMVDYHDKAKKMPKQVYFVLQKNPQILHGSVVSYFSNGLVQSKGQYENGKTKGVWEYYYENGKLKMQGILRDNKPNEYWKYYYETGKLSREGYMKDGDRVGEWKYYHENGNIKSQGNILKGQNEGLWRYYYENAKLKATTLYSDGRGYYKEIYETGQPKMQGLIIDGKSDGTWQYFHENGKLKAEGIEKEGTKQGYWKFYYDNGLVSGEGSYIDGEPNGDWKYYHTSGALSSEGQQVKGQKQGHWKLYYETGQFLGEGFFENGNGPYKEYYDNGKLRIEGYLKNGKNHGTWNYYYDDGIFEGRCEYIAGEGEYTGFYRNSKVKMKGRLKDGQKVGEWSLFNDDGAFAGYYKTYYEKEIPLTKHVPLPADTVKAVVTPRTGSKLDYIAPKKKSRYFTSKINEPKGPIFSWNPAFILFNELPISLEYIFKDRLGYELRYTFIRNPFFSNHATPENDRLYKSGFNIDFRQKLYHPNTGAGSFYISQEARFASMNYRANVSELRDDGSGELEINKYSAIETRFEIGGTVGTRIFWPLGQHLTLSADMYAGLAIGYRQTNVPQALVFQEVKSNKLSIPLRFGLTIGLLYTKHGEF